jgi:CelD/BcsL family acetyltransferase involved in cellulose biosynthesis
VRFLADVDYAPVLAAPEHAGGTMAATLEWLFAAGWRWEELRIDNLLASSPSAEAAVAWLRRRRVAHVADGGAYFYVDLARPFDEVMAETSRRFVRKNVNLARNRLSRAGGYDVEATTDADGERVAATAGPIHAARQAQLGRASFLADPSGRKFLAEVVAHHGARGRFRAYWLRHGGRPVAYMLGFEDAGIYHAWNMAFDPAAEDFYPSRLLIHEILADCHRRGVREFDFMRGEADYKPKWTNHSRPRQKLVVRNRATVYGRALHFLEAVFTRPKEAVTG